jgi:hypothetical protein
VTCVSFCATIDAGLRYAEGKHTSFIAFNRVAAFGGFGILRNLSADGGLYLKNILAATLWMLICAVITSLCSFLPVIVQKTEADAITSSDNVLFFEHVKRHSVDSYIQLLSVKYHVKTEDITPLDRCVVSQISVNARLTSRKFALFKLVAFLDLIAVLLGFGGFTLTFFV